MGTYRHGEVRLVIGLPEPWPESARADFIAALEAVTGLSDVGPFAGIGVGPGDVRMLGMTLVTWQPGVDETPADVVTPEGLDVMVLRYGLAEPESRRRAAAEGFETGYRMGFVAGVRDIADRVQAAVRAPGSMKPPARPERATARGVNLLRQTPTEAPHFDLSPLSPSEVLADAAEGVVRPGDPGVEIEVEGGKVTKRREFFDPHFNELHINPYPAENLNFEEASE
jgi:hypothetical protein